MTKVLAQAMNLKELPVLIGLVFFVFGYMMFGGANSMVYTNMVQALLSAGVSALEGLVQSVPTTITWDILKPLLGKHLGSNEIQERRLIRLNKIVFAGVAGIAIWLSRQQMVNPTLSVGIFAQNGVYVYFAAAFMPVILGIFFRDVPVIAPLPLR